MFVWVEVSEDGTNVGTEPITSLEDVLLLSVTLEGDCDVVV